MFKSYGQHLKACAAMVRMRLYEVLSLLPPKSYEGKIEIMSTFAFLKIFVAYCTLLKFNRILINIIFYIYIFFIIHSILALKNLIKKFIEYKRLQCIWGTEQMK